MITKNKELVDNCCLNGCPTGLYNCKYEIKECPRVLRYIKEKEDKRSNGDR